MLNPSRILAIAIILLGTYCILGGASNWDDLLDSRRARGFVILLGRNCTRVWYVALGVLAVMGGLWLFNAK